MSEHTQEEQEAIARMKARRIIKNFKDISVFGSKTAARIYQKGILKIMKKHQLKDFFELEVMKQINKL